MPKPKQPRMNELKMSFGGGIHSRASALNIDDVEAAGGQNFSLDLERSALCGRKPFDIVGTAPNAQQVRGLAQLKKIDGTVSTLVQAGDTVYAWDGSPTGFTALTPTVDSQARLRGYDWHNWALDERVLITDVEGRQNLMEWDGTTFQEVAHNLTGNLKVKYCTVDDDRALYANVATSTVTPHVILVSAYEDYKDLSVTQRPGEGATAEDDAVFMTAPNLRPINGLVAAFNTTAVSTVGRQMYKLEGRSAKDFFFDKLYPDSGASGPESVAYIGNDIAFGRESQIETMFTSIQLGDVKTDDLSRPIADLTRLVKQWDIQFDRRRSLVYCMDKAGSRIFILSKAILDERIRAVLQERQPPDVSPWSIYTTAHPIAFQTQVMMPMINPQTGLEEMFFGGNDGELFQFEGAGGSDAGAYPVRTTRLSKIYQVQPTGEVFEFSGHVLYAKRQDTSVDLTFLFGGVALSDRTITINLKGAEGSWHFGGDYYWGGDIYWGSNFEGRIDLEKFAQTGRGTTLQIRADFENPMCSIEEILVNFGSA